MSESQSGAVIGVYGSMKDAENAVRALLEQGVPAWEVSIVGQDLHSETQVHGFITTGDSAKAGAKRGAWVGGLFGVLTGAALLFIPGAGALVVLGPLAAGAVAAAEGAAVGGGLGAVLGHFIAHQHIPKYSRHLEAGHYLVLRHGPQAEDVQLLERATTPVDAVEHHPDLVTATPAR
ncbi:general stress protein [Kitasatospora sp. NPDC098663]|uniref:general stress protein n=1 Tax=Kitasatospora sp. NPDC098663 TaxID=3364096 RepID=UPI003829D941